jgi:predicted HAD superfamily Cof-like phosphohydrolase
MGMFTHRYADGDFYTYVGDQEGRHPETGKWVKGVCYRGATGELYWTSEARWEEKFEALPPSRFEEQRIELTDPGTEEVVAAFVMRMDEVTDVRHMLLSACNVASKARDHHVEIVLRAQADMISKGLHIREIDFPDLIGDVNAFHEKFKQIEPTVYGMPRVLPADLFDFRVKFHDEETDEYREEQETLVEAFDREDHREVVNSLELQLDALCDAVWVLLGTADLQFGKKIFYEAWKRVFKANMAKVLATEDPNAKDSGRDVKYDIRKPAGWTPPDHRDLVQEYLRPTKPGAEEPVETNTFNQPVSADYSGKV